LTALLLATLIDCRHFRHFSCAFAALFSPAAIELIFAYFREAGYAISIDYAIFIVSPYARFFIFDSLAFLSAMTMAAFIFIASFRLS
jgi:hypothetical protein